MPLLGKAEKGQLEELILPETPGPLRPTRARRRCSPTASRRRPRRRASRSTTANTPTRSPRCRCARSSPRFATSPPARPRCRARRSSRSPPRPPASPPRTSTASPRNERAARNRDMVARSLAAVWHPCTQMKQHETLPLVPIARGDGAGSTTSTAAAISTRVSSWWVNLFGHAHPAHQRGARRPARTLEHVMLAGFTHEPGGRALRAARARSRRGTLGHCFYASDGASATEIALKMSFHYWRNSGRPARRSSSASRAAITARRSARSR